MNKIKNFGMVMALFITLVLGFGMIGAAKPVSFEETTYSGHPGEDVEMTVFTDYSPLNTTTEDIIDGYYWNYTDIPVALTDDNIEDMTDFNTETGMNVSVMEETETMLCVPAYTWDVLSYAFEFNITPITHFDGIWVKKSVGLELEFSITNNTNGFADSEYTVNFQDGIDYFPYTINQSYKLVEDLTPTEGGMLCTFGGISMDEWVATYGSIDHITVWLYDYNNDKPLNLYEWHLFNTEPVLDYILITDGEDAYIPWGAEAQNIRAGEWLLTIKVPSNAPTGNYFVMVEDNLGNEDTTTLTITAKTETVNNWLPTIVLGIIGVAMIVSADILADTKINKVAVSVLAVVGVILLSLSVIVALNYLGYIDWGISLSILPLGFLALKDGRNLVKTHRREITLGIAFLCVGSCMAMAVSAKNTTVPVEDSINAGDSFTISIYTDANHTALTDDNIVLDITKTDESPVIPIVWHYTVSAATDGLSADILVRTIAADKPGNYQITIDVSSEPFSEVMIYIVGEPEFNWNLFFGTFLGGLAFLALSAFGYSVSQKSKTKNDDYAFIVLGILAAILIFVGIFLFLGWLTYFGFSGALTI
jgi:hypothetical protein